MLIIYGNTRADRVNTRPGVLFNERSNLIFPFRYLIRYLSTFYRLQPGDVIATGTPSGSGARLEPPRYLEAGDTVTVEADGIGTLSNTVAADTGT